MAHSVLQSRHSRVPAFHQLQTAHDTVLYEPESLVDSLGSHLAYSSSDVIVEVRCISRAPHGGESSPLRGIDGYLSPTRWLLQSGPWSHTLSCFSLLRRTRARFREALEVSAALLWQRKTCALVWRRRPMMVRTIKTKPSMSLH